MSSGVNLRSLDIDDMAKLMEELQQPSYRAKQVFRWVHQRGVIDIEQMTDLPAGLRRRLMELARIDSLSVLRMQTSRQTKTGKFLFRLSDDQLIETVLMEYLERDDQRERRTVCLSTQVGCAMGCRFCATGQSGFQRNLTVGEILGQVYDIQQLKRAEQPDFKITNVVYMGMGEPLLNYANVIKSIKLFNHPDGQNIGFRRITLSTCGIVPQIRQLAGENLPIVLAISLHAADNEKRSRLMPVNRRFSLEELIRACSYYIAQTGRRITFEYALINGVNDGLDDARQLAKLIKGLKANVNLIPLNPVKESRLTRPGSMTVTAFARELEAAGITAVVREEKGGDIDAACGQLRKRVGSEHCEVVQNP